MALCENSMNNRVIDFFCDFLHKVYHLAHSGFQCAQNRTTRYMPVGYIWQLKSTILDAFRTTAGAGDAANSVRNITASQR